MAKAGLGESFGLLGRGWPRGVGQAVPFGGSAERADEALEVAAPHDRQETRSTLGLGPVGVRDALPCEDAIACMGAELPGACEKAELPLKHVENLVLVAVDVEWRRIPVRDAMLEHR
jgi:hypothetical protein